MGAGGGRVYVCPYVSVCMSVCASVSVRKCAGACPENEFKSNSPVIF